MTRNPTATLPRSSAAVAILLIVTALLMNCRLAVGQSERPKTACPHNPGYQVITDGQWVAGDGTETVYGTMEEAQAACDDDVDCVAFNNYGSIVKGTLTDITQDGIEACVYVKGTCESVTGYTAFNNTAATNGISNLINGNVWTHANDCSSDSTCVGFTFGDFGSQASGYTTQEAVFGSSLGWAQGKCFYMKNDMLSKGCVPKYGYTTRTSTSLGAMSGSMRGAGFASLTGGAAAAESFCKVNPRCRGWDNGGQVAVGGFVYSAAASASVCTYTKHPCPPRAGFVAYADLTDSVTRPSQRNTSACAADMYTNCLNNPSCTAFDTLRYIWTSKPNPAAAFPGMCTYVRLPGY